MFVITIILCVTLEEGRRGRGREEGKWEGKGAEAYLPCVGQWLR